jgi:CBS domain containing-hemolysin-like protein
LTRLLAPFVWLSEKLTRLLSRGSASAFTFSRDEIRAMADIGAREGVLESKEYKIVANLMKLRQLSVRNIMTPRSVVFSVDETTTVGAFFETHHDTPFSRIPVYGRDREDITGYVLKTDLLIAQARDDFDKPLTSFKREILVVPDIQSASDIYDRLVREKSHIALVVDEYGALQGLVTLEDAVETLVGLEITDEHDAVEDMQELANRRWRERMLAIGIDPEQIRAGKAG